MTTKITMEKYTKIINKILDDPALEVQEKLIKALEEGSRYHIVTKKGGKNDTEIPQVN